MLAFTAIPLASTPPVEQLHPYTSVVVQNGSILLQTHNSQPIARLEECGQHVLRQLTMQSGIDVQYHCTVMGARGGKSRAKKTPPPSVELSAVLYGPESLSQDLADYLEECGLYLQDPRACDRNVVYINPQALAELEGVPLWTQEMRAVHDHETEIFQAPANVLADLENDEELVETIDPCALATPLFKHQRQALTFMHRRERGWAFYGPHYDIWQACSTANSAYGFTNTVSDEVVSEPPAQFRGGILADDMGLGKSLTCIALIASDKDSIDLTSPRKQSLVVVRAPLLETWETQLRRHVRPDALSWRRHHGRDKIKIAEELRPHDIVVTTYQTLLSEWRRNDCGHQPMYAHDWHRIILDEAHDIREGSRATARAIRALRATCRWTVTGTPIQNRLSDLASLYQFLRACPYDDPLVFQDHVRRLGRFGNEEALQRLRRLVCSIMLRRSIGTVELPRREDLLVRLDFSEAELALYNRVGTSTLRILDSASTGAVETQGKGNILTCINNLRQICNLGVHARVSVPSHDNQMSPAPQAWSGEVAQQAYNSLVTIGQAICASCGANQDTASSEVADQVGNALQPSLSSCSRLLCGPCRDSHGVDCTHSPQHAWYAVSSMSSATNNAVTPSSIESDDLPTKIKALASDLEMHTLEEKW